MQTITFDVYSREVAKHIQKIKEEESVTVFSKPTRKQLLNGIMALEKTAISPQDRSVLLAFFRPKTEDLLWQTIANYDLDKLRSLERFIKGLNVSDNLYVIELAALLSDFKDRPWSLFRNQKQSVENEMLHDDSVDIPQAAQGFIQLTPKNENRQPVGLNKRGSALTKRIGGLVLGIIGLSGVTYTVKNILMPEKQCMEWVGDHYELTDCVQEDKNKLIVPYDDYLFDLRKITFCDTMAYQKNGKPLVWYSRKNNQYEFFNKDGTHPVHGGELRKVTPTIYRKHVPSCK